MRILIGLTVAALGAVAIIAALGPTGTARQEPPPRVASLAQSATGTAVPTASPSPSPSASARETARAAVALPDGWRVAMPRLGIDLPLRDGDLSRDIGDQATPVNAAFRLPGSASPGTAGNLYVYAHARSGMFLSLWSAKTGDLIQLQSPTGAILRYVVTEIAARVPVDDIQYMLPTDDERLTLQTSTGPRATDPRFVVVATPQYP